MSVWLVILGKGEAGSHILSEEWVFLVLDILDECRVNGNVDGLALSSDDLLLGAILLEHVVVSLLLLAITLEHLVGDLAAVDTLEVDLGRRGDGVNLVDAFEWHAVDLVWAGDQKHARGKLLQENNSVATESTSEQDEHSAWFETLAQLGWVSLLGSWLSLLVL